VVVGDHGAYVEFNPTHLTPEIKKLLSGTGYTSRGAKSTTFHVNEKCDLHRQDGKVQYADYVIGMVYVKPMYVKFIKAAPINSRKTLFQEVAGWSPEHASSSSSSSTTTSNTKPTPSETRKTSKLRPSTGGIQKKHKKLRHDQNSLSLFLLPRNDGPPQIE